MPIEVVVGTPLAQALQVQIQPKLAEVGWGSGDPSDTAMAEYIILMLVNGKTREEIASELSGELLGLVPGDPTVLDFSGWLFEQVETIHAQQEGRRAEDATVSQDDSATMEDVDMAAEAEGSNSELNASVSPPRRRTQGILTDFRPKGPKAMRNGGGAIRGGARDKRMLGQINRTLDRSHDSVLHRTRGNERINTHSRAPPSGPRMGVGRQPRGGGPTRTANIAHGLANMGGMPGLPGLPGPGLNGMAGGPWMPPGMPGQEVYAMLEQQTRMMHQMQQQMQQQQQMMMSRQGAGSYGQQRGGRPLADRVQHQHRNFRQGSNQQNQNGQPSNGSDSARAEGGADGVDMDMAGTKPNPEETVCRFNLSCTNKDCKFAHQSPAAPPGTAVDVTDVCTFGAACKNRKCVGRHPSPASRTAHQIEQDCKFWPNCTNARCPFKHPSAPPCRNGGDCKTPGCTFTHTKVMCKYNPCTNRFCTFNHEEGQRGVFKDKVWTADAHVSDRKFVDENAEEDNVFSGGPVEAMVEATVKDEEEEPIIG